MDGWIDGWMDGWIDGWMDGQSVFDLYVLCAFCLKLQLLLSSVRVQICKLCFVLCILTAYEWI